MQISTTALTDQAWSDLREHHPTTRWCTATFCLPSCKSTHFLFGVAKNRNRMATHTHTALMQPAAWHSLGIQQAHEGAADKVCMNSSCRKQHPQFCLHQYIYGFFRVCVCIYLHAYRMKYQKQSASGNIVPPCLNSLGTLQTDRHTNTHAHNAHYTRDADTSHVNTHSPCICTHSPASL